MNIDLDKIAFHKVFQYIFLLVATLFSGVLILFYFSYELYLSIPTSKIVLLAIAFTSPFLIWNFSILFLSGMSSGNKYFIFGINADKEKLSFGILLYGCGYTCMFLYISLLISYMGSLSYRGFLAMVLAFEILFTIYGLFIIPKIINRGIKK